VAPRQIFLFWLRAIAPVGLGDFHQPVRGVIAGIEDDILYPLLEGTTW
jgi:hypothetical protein